MFKTLLQHIHKTFIINLKWQVDSGKQKKKKNSNRLKLEPVTTCYLDFVVKVLRKYCGYCIFQKFLKQTN